MSSELTFSLIDEVERAAREFTDRFPIDCVQLIKRQTESRRGPVLEVELVPALQDAASVVLHAEDGLKVVDLHVGKTADFELNPRPWSADRMLVELYAALDAVSRGRFRETLWASDGRVYKASARLDLSGTTWRIAARFGWRNPFRTRTLNEISYGPWISDASTDH